MAATPITEKPAGGRVRPRFAWLSDRALVWTFLTPTMLLLLAIAIWSFARAYYFAFYVIEHYIDGEYKFAGLWSFWMYLLSRKK